MRRKSEIKIIGGGMIPMIVTEIIRIAKGTAVTSMKLSLTTTAKERTIQNQGVTPPNMALGRAEESNRTRVVLYKIIMRTS